jgi:hypothetical protein
MSFNLFFHVFRHYLISEARLTHAMKGRDSAGIGGDFEYDSNDDFDDVLEDSDLSCDADDEYDCDYTDDETSEDDIDGLPSRYTSSDRHDDTSEDDMRRVSSSAAAVVGVGSRLTQPDDRYDDLSVRSRDRNKINSLFAGQTSPTAGSQSVATSGQTSQPTKSHSLTQIASNLSRNNSSVNQTTGKRLTTQIKQHSTPSPTAPVPPPHMRPQTPPNSRQISQTLSLVPKAVKATTGVVSGQSLSSTTGRGQHKSEAISSQKTSLLSIESFAKENIERHRKRGIFAKKVSLKSMLEWSKKSIKKPMISSISDQKLRHESKVMFKFVQKFMRDVSSDPSSGVVTTSAAVSSQQSSSTTGVGVQSLSTSAEERHPTPTDDVDIALHLLSVAAQQPILRDELLVQIARQTTNNPNQDSELRGLRLMCCCFWYFPPSPKLAPHLQQFVSTHGNVFAREVVLRKFEQQLRRSQSSHVVYVRRPHDRQEVSRVLTCVTSGFVGVFGETLSDALVSERLIPWFVH